MVSGNTGLKIMEKYDKSHRKYIVFLYQLTLRRIGSSPAGDEAPLTKACLHNLIKQDPFTTTHKLLTFRRKNKICLPHKKCNLHQNTKYSSAAARFFNRFTWIFYRKQLSVFLMLSDVVVIISPQVFTKRDHLKYEIHFVCFLESCDSSFRSAQKVVIRYGMIHWAKWPAFCKRYFQINSLMGKLLHIFYSNLTEILSKWSNQL